MPERVIACHAAADAAADALAKAPAPPWAHLADLYAGTILYACYPAGYMHASCTLYKNHVTHPATGWPTTTHP